MKIPFQRIIILCLLLLMTARCGPGENVVPNFDAEEEVQLNPAYFKYVLAGIILLAVAGAVVVGVVSVKRGKKKREDLVSQINKAYKSGEILDPDYDHLKKGLDPMDYAWLIKAFDFALINKRRYDYLHSKYPKDLAIDLFEQKNWIGMTIEHLIDSRGHPSRTEDEILKTKTIRIFTYDTPNGQEMFSFVEGILERSERK
jgi:hypothetical protein